jgi:hypothetical protein
VTASLRTVATALETDSRFLAGWLGAEAKTAQQRLALDEERFLRLLISSAPRPSRFAGDVEAIADELGLDATVLAAALREAAAISSLREQPVAQAVGLLAAARDTGPEARLWRTRSRVRAAVESFWSNVPERWRTRTDLERIAPLAVPVAIVALPRLSIARATDWLEKRMVSLQLAPVDRRLRAMLISWRGTSLLFVDGALDPGERRVSVAHELGHVWLHYLADRRRLLRRAPDLFSVVDAHRDLTPQDRAKAALEGVPLGIQTHLLARPSDGVGLPEVEAVEQEAAEFALELVAPEEDVAAFLGSVLPFDLRPADALEQGTRLVGEKYELPPDDAAARARAGLEILGRSPGFFER